MREIPSLQTMCLRNVGGKACSAEVTFADDQDGNLSSASKLLRSFYLRGTAESGMNSLPLLRTPAIGDGSARRKQANDVDLNHPWAAVLDGSAPVSASGADGEAEENEENIKPASSKQPVMLVAEFNTPALDLLQSYIDSLVELSRMDDARLGLHFFQEWRALVIAKDMAWAAAHPNVAKDALRLAKVVVEPEEVTEEVTPSPSKRRRRSRSPQAVIPASTPEVVAAALTNLSDPPPLSSLSLYNTIIQDETIQAMVESNMTYHLAVLDLTGIQSLQDAHLQQILVRAPHLQRLSIKNCRRLTHSSLECLSDYATQLTSLDIGGTYNLEPSRVIETVAALSKLDELHASGLLWNDALLGELASVRNWKALSLGFLIPGHTTANGLKAALINQGASLTSLAIPFCEHMVDAALLGVLGRHLPLIECLDVRGNSALNSMTGWYDGRATIQPMVAPRPLFVLGRYSGVTKANIEDTKRIHPLQAAELECSLGSDGVGKGIRRYQANSAN